MLKFEIAVSKDKVVNDELAGFVFKFKNLTDKLITTLWYKFMFYRNGIITDDYPPHEFLFEIPALEAREQKFGEVNIPEYYLSGDDQSGNFKVVVAVKYFVQGQKQSKKVTSETEFQLSTYEGGLD